MTRASTSRQRILAIARRHGWLVLHDLGLHVELTRPESGQRLAIQFNMEGLCTWCQYGLRTEQPFDAALRQLVE